jgi:hypothetical protein
MQPTCQLDGCAQPVRSRGLCYAHYMRAWRYGDPLHRPGQPHADLTGSRFGCLTVLKYRAGLSRQRPSTWLCRCDCGATTSVRTGDLRSGSVTTCGANAHRRLADVGYTAVHDRLRTDRGQAASQTCIDCGRSAAQWSYDHLDPEERAVRHHRRPARVQPLARPLRALGACPATRRSTSPSSPRADRLRDPVKNLNLA